MANKKHPDDDKNRAPMTDDKAKKNPDKMEDDEGYENVGNDNDADADDRDEQEEITQRNPRQGQPERRP